MTACVVSEILLGDAFVMQRRPLGDVILRCEVTWRDVITPLDMYETTFGDSFGSQSPHIDLVRRA